MLLQIKESCCKLNKVVANFQIVAANFQNELLVQIKRMLLQIKTSKVCARIAFIVNSIHVFSHLRLKSEIKCAAVTCAHNQ